MEEIEESKDSADNKIISDSTLLSEGSPSELTRDIKPGFDSSTKTTKIKMKFQKMCLCAASYLQKKYVYLFRLHQLAAKMTLWNSMHFLTQVQIIMILFLGSCYVSVTDGWGKIAKSPSK